MIIHLVRHAHAGNRSAWSDDDSLRPLSEKGHAQAEAIAGALAEEISGLVGLEGTAQLWSSPYIRCLQTLEPLGQRLDLEVRAVDALAEGGYGADALELLLASSDGLSSLVACSHGDVIPDLVAAAVRRGADLEGDAVPRKAARYVLEVGGGQVTHITHVVRPEV